MSQSNEERTCTSTEKRLADEHRQEASGRGATGHQDSKEEWLGTPRTRIRPSRTRITATPTRRSGSISAATTDIEHLLQSTTPPKRTKTGYSNAETDPTTVQDTSVKTQTSRTDTQKRNTGTTQITRSLASSTQPTERARTSVPVRAPEQDQAWRTSDMQRVAGYRCV